MQESIEHKLHISFFFNLSIFCEKVTSRLRRYCPGAMQVMLQTAPWNTHAKVAIVHNALMFD